MDDLSEQQPPFPTGKEDNHVVIKSLQLLYDGGFEILENHKAMIPHREELTKQKRKGYVKRRKYCQDKPSLSLPEAGQSKTDDVLHVAAIYASTKNASSKTPLHLCAEIGDIEIVEIFQRIGAKVDVEDRKKVTPLHVCAEKGHKNIVEVFLKAGAFVDVKDKEMKTPLHYSVCNGHKDIVEILLKAGTNVDAKDSDQ